MPCHGIIFDFNGVLLWDSEWQVKSWQGVAKKLRGREMTEEELARQVHGRPNADVLSYLAGRPIEGRELAELIQAKESFYRELCVLNPRRFVLSPGAEELLNALDKLKIPRTIATSSEITNVRFFIQHLRLDRWFDVDKIVYDNGVRPGKPAPDVYVEAARQIGVEPHWCLVVEDAISGLASAQAAGIGYLVALGAPATHPMLLQLPGVSLAIKSLRDFPRNLLGIKPVKKGKDV
jgi:HAD superfamily hydrolase (TIGR01509 family)